MSVMYLINIELTHNEYSMDSLLNTTQCYLMKCYTLLYCSALWDKEPTDDVLIAPLPSVTSRQCLGETPVLKTPL